MSISNSIIENLEARTFLSASALNATIQADHLQITTDLLKFRSDCAAKTATLLADITTIKADTKPADAASLLPLVKQFRSDMAAMRSTLLADRLAEASNVLADESIIITELKQTLTDKGNAVALTADKAQLKTDRIKLQDDMVAGLTARLTTRQNAYDTISADCEAIVTAVQNDTGSSTKLIADVTRFATDRTTTLNTLSGDLAKLLGDREQLVTDLTASDGN